MAYALRYYKELIHEDGSAHRLEIHKKDSTAEAVEIGAVIQGLALEIQGSQGDVDSPIVKTSLSMTFVDAGDIEDGRKNGFWQEFYTPDALLWKVILKARTATETSFRTMWGGYVTPDSFSESLVYRGSVNIIARDNLGHMQDFPFDAVGDADGLISLRNLVEAGWEKIQSPMVLDWRGETESNMWLMCDGVPAPDTLMNVSQFEGMDWYKAIETALASYGIVMRWVGDNIVNVSSLRSMPLQGREVMDNLSQITPVFVAGAQRELVPAVRRIEESVSYDLQETLSMPKLDSSAFTGDTQSYRCKIDGVDIGYGQFGTLEHDAPIWPINPNNGWSDEDDATTLFFNPKAYELGTFASRRGLGDEIYRYMYIAANNVDDRRVSFTRSITCADVTISMKLGQPCNLDILSRIEQQSVFNLKRITFAVILEQGGVTRYYNGRSWGASYAEISVDYDPTSPSYEFSQFVSMDDNAGAAELTFCIVKIEYAQTSYVGNSSVYGLYACIQDLSFNIPESSSLLSDNSVNTVYNAENNVILSRTPEIGPAYNAVALPGLIKNGIFYRSEGVILPARAWGWSGSTPQQMAVYNHLQLLCYYAKPNNLISGTIVNGDLTRGGAIYLWHGKEHLLVSGRYNLLNGMIEGAMLREFTRYEAMWGEVSETAFPDTEQDSTTNVEGGASSGGSSSTYTNTTTVNIGSGGGGGASYLNDLLDVNTDSVTAQSVLYYNGTEWVGRSLSTILNGYAKSADLLTLSNLLASMWSIDAKGNLVTDKQVIIKNNLIVEGDTASGGEGGGSSSVGIQGIVVNGVTYRDTDGDGLIDLGTIGGGTLTEITSAMITEALGYTPVNPSALGSLAYKNSLTWSEISGKPSFATVATSGKYSDLSGLPTIPTVPTKVSAFTNDSGYITESAVNSKLAAYQPISTAINTSNIGSQKVAGFATARTIWGQSFDGTGNVSGALTLGTSNGILDGSAKRLLLSDGSNLYLGTTDVASYATYITGNYLYMRYGASSNTGMILNSSGNVTIGSSDLAGTSYKMYVDGAATFAKGRVTIPSSGDRVTTNAASGYTMGILAMNTYNTYIEAPLATNSSSGAKTPIMIGWRDGTYPFYISASANVGIGITNPSYKLHVDGTAKINDITRLGANLYVSQDATAYGLQLWGDADGGYIGVHAKGSYKSVNARFGYDGSTQLYGAVTMSSTLNVAGNTTINGNLVVAGDISA